MIYLIKKPYHTEKAMKLHGMRKYTFLVGKEANKQEIKKEVERLYRVGVTDVNTSITRGKKITRYTRTKMMQGQRKDYKKAIITVKEGDIIDTHDHHAS